MKRCPLKYAETDQKQTWTTPVVDDLDIASITSGTMTVSGGADAGIYS